MNFLINIFKNTLKKYENYEFIKKKFYMKFIKLLKY